MLYECLSSTRLPALCRETVPPCSICRTDSYQTVRSVPADQSTVYVTISSLVTAIIQQDYSQKVKPLVRPRTEWIIAQVKRECCTVVKDERNIKGRVGEETNITLTLHDKYFEFWIK